jgi:hypothetical protein
MLFRLFFQMHLGLLESFEYLVLLLPVEPLVLLLEERLLLERQWEQGTVAQPESVPQQEELVAAE